MPRNAVDILGIGAQKSATSWAAHVLNLNPKVWIPKDHALSGKEVNFFTGPNWQRGVEWYQEIMAPPGDGSLSADISPAYSVIGVPKIKVCRKIAPNAKVFLQIRNPIHRDWSSLIMQATRRKLNLEATSFVDLMVFYDREGVARFSTYDATVERWRNIYGDQLMVATYDDICADPHAYYQRLCAHVGLNPEDVDDWQRKIETRIFEGPGTPMPEEMFEFLSKKYTPMVERLSRQLDYDLSFWLSQRPRMRHKGDERARG